LLLLDEVRRESKTFFSFRYKEDFGPFLEGCECLACRQHTKAYTNHLVETRELLAPMLLTIHNLHHYIRFFDAIREAIQNDRLAELIALVTEQYKEVELDYAPLDVEVKSQSRKISVDNS